MIENWKVIEGYQNYAVSTFGRIKRLTPEKNTRVGKILKLSTMRSGYKYVTLTNNGTQDTKRVSVLVAKAFLSNKQRKQVNHIDSDKTNNRIDNLEWVTPKENVQHAIKHQGKCGNAGLKGEQHPKSKLTESDVFKIKGLLGKMSQEKIGRLFSVHQSTISDISTGRRWAMP